VSKHINVNPDHYKVAGRERPGNQVAKAPQQPDAQNKDLERWEKRRKKLEGQVGRKKSGTK
jgi:hypothetical protein